MRTRHATGIAMSLSTALWALPACSPPLQSPETMDMAPSGTPPDQAAAAPTITSITPGKISSAGGSVSVKGTNLRVGLSAMIDGVGVTVAPVTGDEVRLTAPARPGRFGPVEVVLRNPDSQSANDTRSLSYYLNNVALGAGPGLTVDLGRGGVVADLDKDGKPDFLIGGNLSVSTFKGDGKGGFGAATTYPTGCQAIDLVYADFTGDKIGDAVINCFDGQTLVVLPGKADGTFGAALPAITTTVRPQKLASGDFNKDGKQDLIVSHGSINQNAVWVLLGKGDGTFQAPIKLPITDQATVPEFNQPCVGVADFNKDGNLDAYVCLYQMAKMGVFLGKGDGNFGAMQTLPVSTSGIGARAGDVNGDGMDDLLVTDNLAHTVGVFLSKGDGTFRDRQTYMGFNDPREIHLLDVNQDGALDVVVANYYGTALSLLMNNGSGSFTAAQMGPPAPVNTIAITIGDLNGDGLPDIVTAPYKGTVATLLNTSR